MNRFMKFMRGILGRIIACFFDTVRTLLDEYGGKRRYRIENRRWFLGGCSVDFMTPEFVKIGRNFVSAPNSIIAAHDASYYIFTEKYRVEPTEIGDDVFLGMGAVVLAGVKVGNRVVIGAGSVVTHDVPDNCVVAGNPARVICTLDEYLRRAEAKGVLYPSPFSHDDWQKQAGRATPKQLRDIRKSMAEQYRRRNPTLNSWIKYDDET